MKSIICSYINHNLYDEEMISPDFYDTYVENTVKYMDLYMNLGIVYDNRVVSVRAYVINSIIDELCKKDNVEISPKKRSQLFDKMDHYLTNKFLKEDTEDEDLEYINDVIIAMFTRALMNVKPDYIDEMSELYEKSHNVHYPVNFASEDVIDMDKKVDLRNSKKRVQVISSRKQKMSVYTTFARKILQDYLKIQNVEYNDISTDLFEGRKIIDGCINGTYTLEFVSFNNEEQEAFIKILYQASVLGEDIFYEFTNSPSVKDALSVIFDMKRHEKTIQR